jgi:hypothetical protein
MNWYKKAQQTLDISSYLSQEEQEMLQQKQQTIEMYQNGIKEKQQIAQSENRELNERENTYIKGAQFYIEKIQNDINELLKSFEQEVEHGDDRRQREHLISEAKNHFGLTEDLREVGYILPDGTMLDFSQKNEGGPGGERPQDHRDISHIDEGDLLESGTAGMIGFMGITGSVRFAFYNERMTERSMTINMIQPLTTAQIEKLKEASKWPKIDIFIDVDDKQGNTIWSKEHKGSRGLNKVLQEANSYANSNLENV